MGSKKQESTIVTERRLRPIYDSLDIGNNKVALSEAEKLLKKQPDLVCAKALRALALTRLARVNEAVAVLKEIEMLDPDEEYTLQALTYCYRDLGRPESIITMYERAAKKHPQNEEFLSHLMMAYVRVGEHKRQNHIAMQLYKLRPTKNPYYFWSVMSTVMQAYDDPKLARTMYLPLAERMIEKFIKDDKLNAEAEVKLYILILEMQEKYAEAVAVLQGDLMSRFVKCMWDSNQKIVELLEKLQRWQEIYDLCERRLPENIDDWFTWAHLFSAAFELIKQDVTRKLSIIEKLTTIVLSNLSLVGQQQNQSLCRGPYLARMRLIACLLERDYVVRSELGEPRELLLDYFRRFGDRPSLLDDVTPYLWLLGEEQQSDFVGRLEEACGGLPVGVASSQSCDMKFAQDLKYATIHQNALQLVRCLGRHSTLSLADNQRMATDLVRRYEAALCFGADLLATEMQPADGYLLLALHTIWDIYVDVGDIKFVYEMLLLCEQGLKRSASNFRLKGLLMKLYSLLGGATCVLRLCESMDIKYILRDTLWYLLCDQLSPWGLYLDLIDWSRVSLTFYAQSEKEIVDCVVQCYKSGSFPTILEFFDFRKKLRNSFHFRACQVWRRFYSVINEGANMDFIIAILKETPTADVLKSNDQWPSFSNNCDFSVIPCWYPEETMKAAERMREEAQQQQVDQLRFYQLLLVLLSLLMGEDRGGCCPGHDDGRATATADDAVNNVATIKAESSGAVDPATDDGFLTVLSELRAHCKYCRSNYCGSTTIALSSMAPNSPVSGFFGMYLAGSYPDVLACVFESAFTFLKAISSTSDCCHQAPSSNGVVSDNGHSETTRRAVESENRMESAGIKVPSADETQQLLKAMFSSHQLQGSGGGFPFLQICHVSFLVQTLSIVLITVSLMLRRAREAQSRRQLSSKDKKQKKKKGQQAPVADIAEDPRVAEFLQFACTFGQAAETTVRLVEDLSVLLEADTSLCSVNDTKFLPAEFCKTKSEVVSNLRNSYKHSIKELQRVMEQNIAGASSWFRGQEAAKPMP